MTVVGTAELVIVPITTGFEKALKEEVSKSGGAAAKEAELQGATIGGGYRKGVTKETEKLAGDVEKHSTKAGSALEKGLAFGLAGVATAAVAAGVDVGESMQKAEAGIAAASGTSIKAATQIGTAFEGTAFKSEFSSVQMAKAFAGVAGQLKETEGHALNAKQAMEFMAAADDLATAKQIDLGTATQATAGIMQAFHLGVGDAAHVTDVLFTTSVKTGQGVDTLASSLERMHSRLGSLAPNLGEMSGLLVDLTDRGITGRTAMSVLGTAMNGLEKAADTTSTAGKKLHEELKQMGVTVFDQKGNFVGLRDVISELHGKFADMTTQQQIAAATTLFGAGAARQMIAVIQAGPDAYDKATGAVNRHGTAQAAAAVQSKTLHVEEETLKAGVIDLAAKLGGVLIPAFTAVTGVLLKATTYVVDHKGVLIALAAVVTGILGPAIAVFAINKMASFVNSFKDASGHVKQFATDVEGVVSRVTSAFGKQTSAAQTAATNLGTATSTMADDTSTAAATIEGENATAGGSFTTMAGESTAAAGVVEGDVAAEATAVTTADTTIEAENTVAGGSFASLGATASGALASLGVGGGVAGAATLAAPLVIGGALAASGAGGPLPKGTSPSYGGGGGREGGLSGGGSGSAPSTLSSTAQTLGITLPSGNAVVAAPNSKPRRSRIHGAGDVSAHAASANLPGLNASQSAIAAEIIAEGQRLGASPTAIQAALDAAFGESGFNPGAVNSQTGDSGVFQSTTHEPTAAQIQGWYTGGTSFGGGGGIAQAKRGFSTGQIATDVEVSGMPASYYGNHDAQSAAIMRAYGLSAPGSFAPPSAYAGAIPSTQTAAVSAAQTKAAVTSEIAKETASVNAEIASLKSSVSGKGVSQDEKTKVAGEIAALKGALQVEVAQQKGALSVQTAQQKAELSKQTTDLKAGTSELTKLLGDVHSTNLKQLTTDLDKQHNAALTKLERDLDRDHSTALSRLSAELVAVHKQAMDNEAKQVAAAAATALAAATTKLYTTQATDISKAAQDQVRVIQEQSKVSLDQQGLSGLSGLALAAGQAQLKLDQLTLTGDNQVAAAQARVDADTAAGASAEQLASDNKTLASVQGEYAIKEAQAQATLDQANFNAQQASNSGQNVSGTATNAPAAAPNVVQNIQIYGQGLPVSGIMTELAFSIRTGALPVAPPPAVPA